MELVIVLCVFLCLPSLFLLRNLLRHRSSLQGLPPGPKGLPLLGNVFDMPDPAEKAHLHWRKLNKLYGPLSSVTVFGQTIIILNDYDTAVELLENNSAVFSGRAPLTFVGKMVGWGRILPFSQYGDLLRQYRRDWHQFLGTRSAVKPFMPVLEVENRRLLNMILQDHFKWRDHLRRAAGSTILRILYGYKVEPEGIDPLLSIADQARSELTQSISPGAWAVDILPILRYLPEWTPGLKFKRIAREWRNHMIEFVDRPYQFTKESLSTGAATPSFVSLMLSSLSSPLTAEDESRTKWGASGIYAGSSETTVSAMHTFFLAMLLHPNVQRKAQKEIDNVIGADRLPTSEDRAQLPYVEAVFKECLRWNVVAPIALPHASDEEHVYCGYRIPKGSIIIVNIWEYAHDPNVYTDPSKFNPSRFLEDDGSTPEMDPREYIYGFGRRICPGKEFADATMWLTVATCLTVFSFEKIRDETGKEVTPSREYDNGFVCLPKYFPCSISPRSKNSEALIQSVDYEHPYEKGDSEILERVKWGEEMM